MTDEAGRLLHQQLADHEQDVLRHWILAAQQRLAGRVAEAELQRSFGDLLPALREAVELAGLDVTAEPYRTPRALLGELSREWARRGFTPSETATGVYELKDALFGELKDRPDALAMTLAVSRWVDALGMITFESYAHAREQVIKEQNVQLLELTTPVVKLWEGVLAVPLIGTLDSARAQIVMEKLLQTLVETGADHAIIDITGVPAVDTEVAQHLLKTVVAARLMGAGCTISGIRPQIAQTIVALGIEFGDIPTKASLADALLHALRGTGYEVVRRDRSRTT